MYEDISIYTGEITNIERGESDFTTLTLDYETKVALEYEKIKNLKKGNVVKITNINIRKRGDKIFTGGGWKVELLGESKEIQRDKVTLMEIDPIEKRVTFSTLNGEVITFMNYSFYKRPEK